MIEYCSEKPSQSISIAQNALEFTQKWVAFRGQITLTPTEFQENEYCMPMSYERPFI